MVTGIGGGGLGEQIIKALRLASTKYVIVGGDMSPLSKGLMVVDYPYLLPPATNPRYIDCIFEICKRHSIKAIFLGSEPELKEFSKNREKFQRAGIFLPINPESVISICMDKFKTMEILSQNGISVPQTIAVRSMKDVERINFLPAVLKPSVGGSGSVDVLLVQTREELNAFSHYLLSQYSEFIAQEYVGTPDSEYTVGILCSMEGEFLNSIAVKRNIIEGLSNRIKVPNRTGDERYGPFLTISSGISQGQIGHFPEVTRPCEEIASLLGCHGVCNIQCRVVNGKVIVFEINPRFSGTTSFRAMVGYNEPDVLIRRHLLNERIVPRFPYRSGVIMRGLEETFIENQHIKKAADLL